MKSILENLGLLDEQKGAGTGTWLPCTGEILESVSPIEIGRAHV